MLSEKKELTCGIIMPIASMHDYTSDHWQEVKNIIIESTQIIEEYSFKTEIVSNSDGEIDVIHKRIIQNLYNSDIVVCDISGKNPNVLFELGMRLTFDKPTIIIKDDKTDFIFDTGVIEHITYPKDLRFQKIVEFKTELSRRIKATYNKSQSDENFSTFLKNFGVFQVPKLEQSEITEVDQVLLEELKSIRKEMNFLRNEIPNNDSILSSNKRRRMDRNEYAKIHWAIDKYLRNTKDSDPANLIFKKKSFNEHLNLLDLSSISHLPINEIVNMIHEQQIELQLIPAF